MVVRLGFPPGRIDIVGSISGITFDEVYPERILKKLGNVEIWFIGLNTLIQNKEATGRKKDIVDAEQLRRLILKKSK